MFTADKAFTRAEYFISGFKKSLSDAGKSFTKAELLFSAAGNTFSSTRKAFPDAEIKVCKLPKEQNIASDALQRLFRSLSGCAAALPSGVLGFHPEMGHLCTRRRAGRD